MASSSTKSFWKKKPKCSRCGNTEEEPFLWCSKCNGLMEIEPICLKGTIDFKNQFLNGSMWDFSEFLPRFKNIISLNEGATPILQLHNTSSLKGLNVKLEYRNPTGSFRDRGSSLIISHALSTNQDTIKSVSTGSYGISLAAYAAAASINSITVIPENMELSKIEQLRVFGTKILQHGENLNQAKKFAEEELEGQQRYKPSPKENILTIEGQKTIGLEIAHQKVQNLDAIIVPRGSGSLILSIYKGLQDALCSGWIEKIPRIVSVSLQEDSSKNYLIESLEISELDKLMLTQVSKIISDTEGTSIKINADDMIDTALNLAKNEGHFIEPASASVISAARFLAQEGKINPSESIAILSGSGLNALNIFASQMRKMKKVVWGLAPTSTRKFEILNLIADNQATNGSEIWTALGKKKTRQSVYQHLSELEDVGLIKGEMKTKKAKKYFLTRKGFEALDRMRDLIDLL